MVLFLRSKKGFRYIPENESEQPVLGWNKSNYICYQRVREAHDAGVLRVDWIPGKFNMADVFTKTAMPGNTMHNLVDPIFLNTASSMGDTKKV